MPTLQVGLKRKFFERMKPEERAAWLEEHAKREQFGSDPDKSFFDPVDDDENPFPDWLKKCINKAANARPPKGAGFFKRLLWNIGVISNDAEYDFENIVYLINCESDDDVRQTSSSLMIFIKEAVDSFDADETSEYSEWNSEYDILLSCKLFGDEEQLNREIDELYGARGKGGGGKPNMGEN